MDILKTTELYALKGYIYSIQIISIKNQGSKPYQSLDTIKIPMIPPETSYLEACSSQYIKYYEVLSIFFYFLNENKYQGRFGNFLLTNPWIPVCTGDISLEN